MRFCTNYTVWFITISPLFNVNSWKLFDFKIKFVVLETKEWDISKKCVSCVRLTEKIYFMSNLVGIIKSRFWIRMKFCYNDTFRRPILVFYSMLYIIIG